MTHTLHRAGNKENLRNDYVVFLMAAQKVNTEGSKAKLQHYLEIAREYGAVNIGDGREGCLCGTQDYDWIVEHIKDGVVAHAVFDSQEKRYQGTYPSEGRRYGDFRHSIRPYG